MASYDQLSAQQRAIVDLILKRGQGYDQLADKLDMPVGRVREVAVEALTNLAPVSARAVDTDWREQLTDYLLNQQQPPEAAATRGHLRRSESARAWSRSVLDSLEHLYVNGDLPTIPAGDGGGSEPEPAPKKAAAARGALSPEAEALVRRRRAIGIAAIAAALLFIVLIWPVGLLTGDDDDGGGDSEGRARTEIVGQVRLRPVDGAGRTTDGVAIVTRRNDDLELNVQAAVPRTKRNQAYEVWLYNSPQDARSLGAQVTDAQGNFAGRSPLPANYRNYRFIDISRETVDRNVAHGGQSVLRARVDRIRRPQGR
ncbi:MAG TPA: hypothetical protein VEX36_02990 [Thermoleophilaceae bacterium]|nr:hypothetical protein [Thermoleophilaceae bacterium]